MEESTITSSHVPISSRLPEWVSNSVLFMREVGACVGTQTEGAKTGFELKAPFVIDWQTETSALDTYVVLFCARQLKGDQELYEHVDRPWKI